MPLGTRCEWTVCNQSCAAAGESQSATALHFAFSIRPKRTLDCAAFVSSSRVLFTMRPCGLAASCCNPITSILHRIASHSAAIGLGRCLGRQLALHLMPADAAGLSAGPGDGEARLLHASRPNTCLVGGRNMLYSASCHHLRLSAAEQALEAETAEDMEVRSPTLLAFVR